jgi:hypothetical protein
VFAGTLKSGTRQMAWEDVASVGGIPQRTVTKRTNNLVTGDINRKPGEDPRARGNPPVVLKAAKRRCAGATVPAIN